MLRNNRHTNYAEKLLLGLGKFNSGTVRNITPGYAKIEGSIRGLSSEIIFEFLSSINHILKKIEKQSGVGYKITKGAHYPEVVVDSNLYSKLQSVLSSDFKFIDCGYKMTGEDFGFYSQKWPSFIFWLGTSKGERYGLHNPKFLPPDEVIQIGSQIFESILSECN